MDKSTQGEIGLELDEQELFEVLSHSIRRQILRELAQEIRLSYSDLKKSLGHGPGVIYHHLQKLQELGFLHQREDKEYELTSTGNLVVTYMKQATEGSFPIEVSPSQIQTFFLRIPITRFVIENPLRWTFEVGLLLIPILTIQIGFPILVIGFFLVPSQLSFPLRIGLQFFLFLVMALLLEAGSFLWNRQHRSRLQFFSSLLIFPAMSAVGVGILWIVSLAISPVPSLFYWITTVLLQSCYFYVLIQILMSVKELSFERSVILALLVSYISLISGYSLA